MKCFFMQNWIISITVKWFQSFFFCTDDLLSVLLGKAIRSVAVGVTTVTSPAIGSLVSFRIRITLGPNYQIPAQPLLHYCTYQNSDLITLQFKILKNNLNIHNSTLSCCCIIVQGSIILAQYKCSNESLRNKIMSNLTYLITSAAHLPPGPLLAAS